MLFRAEYELIRSVGVPVCADALEHVGAVVQGMSADAHGHVTERRELAVPERHYTHGQPPDATDSARMWERITL